MTNSAQQSEVDRAVKVCPQCEGEGGYADGLDEAACHEDCPRCGTNGWIVDIAALAILRPEVSEAEVRAMMEDLRLYLDADDHILEAHAKRILDRLNQADNSEGEK